MSRKQILQQILLLVFLLPAFEASSQSEEILLAPVKTGGELGYYGYIDKTGKMAIEPQFDGAGDFQEGLAPIKMGDKWGYINKAGKMVIKPQFGGVYYFQKGRAWIQIGYKWGCIDKTGKIVIKPQFDEAEGFQEGLAMIKFNLHKHGYTDSHRPGGFIDKTGKIVFKLQFGL